MLDLLLPEQCVLCSSPPRRLCRLCHEKLDASPQRHNLGRHDLFSSGAAEPSLLTLIRAYKDECRTGLARELSSILRPVFASALERHGAPDLVVVPPSAWRSWRHRGFRPVPRVLARMGVAVFPALVRRSLRGDQRGLNLEQRESNMAGAFYARQSLSSARVFLVDDVVTTGSTVSESIRALEAAGAKVVCVIALVRVAPRREKRWMTFPAQQA